MKENDTVLKNFASQQAELEALRREISFLRTLVNDIPIPIFAKNQDAKFCILNDAYKVFFNLMDKDLLNLSVLDLEHLSEEDRLRYQKEDLHVIENTAEIHYETIYGAGETKSSALYWSKGLCVPETGERGLVGVIVDISTQKHLEHELANAIEEKNVANEHMKIMLDSMPLCTSFWDKNQNILDCNQKTVQFFDLLDKKEYLENFSALSPEYQPDGMLTVEKVNEKFKEAFENGYAKFEWLHQKLNGELIPTEIILVRTLYNGETVVLGYTRDLREFKAMLQEIQKNEDELRLARDTACESARAKSAFLANMSHEIRTPMNVISGMAEIILRESEGRSVSEYATEIKSACGSLLTIINDILDISKIESGKLDLIVAEYDFDVLINDIITIARMRLSNTPLEFFVYIDSSLPAKLIGDSARIKQILINLVNNAIKFTFSGYVGIKIHGNYTNGKAHLTFDIYDTGEGIREADIPKLFTEFERFNATKNRAIEGTGLGLPISKYLCEIMNASLTVKSIFGEGSTFTMNIMQEYTEYLPLAFVAQKKIVLLYESRKRHLSAVKNTIENLGSTCIVCENQSELYEKLNEKEYDYILTSPIYLEKIKAIKEKHALDAKIILLVEPNYLNIDREISTIILPTTCLQIADALNNKISTLSEKKAQISFEAPEAKILLVDDNLVNLKVAIGLMEPYKFIIDTAQDGVEAVKMVTENIYDLVLMDHMMPEMDGVDATIAIRKLEGDYYKNLPIIALTANALVGTKELFIQEGMNDFLSKPIDLDKLNDTLFRWLRKDKINTLESNGITTSKAYDIKIGGINVERGIRQLGGSIDGYVDIITTYYTDGIKKLAAIKSYSQERNLSALKNDVHALKSASASIGAMNISYRAEKLEDAANANNWKFIEENTKTFLDNLSFVLDEIKKFLLSLNTQDKIKDKEQGEKDTLKENILTLAEAISSVDIVKIENILEFLLSYVWETAITDLLLQIQDCIATYEYDKALPLLERIKKELG